MNTTAYNIVKKENGKFGLQRVGGVGVYGNFDTWVEALIASAEAVNAANTRHE